MQGKRHVHHHSLGGRGFTLVEAVISILIMAVTLSAGLTAVGHAARDRGAIAEMREGQLLASALMTEILAQRYQDPNGAAPPGGTDRTLFNDVSDYEGLNETTIATKDNQPVSGTTGWKRAVRVRLAEIDGSTGTLSGSVPDVGLKQIRVTVTSPKGKQTQLSALRSAWGGPDGATPSTGATSGVTISIRVGADRQMIHANVDTLNRPTP